jgi:hypothetical protein
LPPDRPAGSVIPEIQDSAVEFLADWLIRKNIEEASAFISDRSLECIRHNTDQEGKILSEDLRNFMRYFPLLRLVHCSFFMALAIPLFPMILFAKRSTDLVVMQNGDQWHGEVNKLEKGKLKFDANYLFDPIQLDWSKVVRLRPRPFSSFK